MSESIELGPIFIILNVVIKVIFDEFSFGEGIVKELRGDNLFHFIVDDVFGNFSKPKVIRIHMPIIRSFLLLSRIIVEV